MPSIITFHIGPSVPIFDSGNTQSRLDIDRTLSLVGFWPKLTHAIAIRDRLMVWISNGYSLTAGRPPSFNQGTD
jgi:hypothetical protein